MKGSEDVSGATLLIVTGVAAGRLGAVADTVMAPVEFFDLIIRAHLPAKLFTVKGPNNWQVRLPKKLRGWNRSGPILYQRTYHRGSERRRDNGNIGAVGNERIHV